MLLHDSNDSWISANTLQQRQGGGGWRIGELIQDFICRDVRAVLVHGPWSLPGWMRGEKCVVRICDWKDGSRKWIQTYFKFCLLISSSNPITSLSGWASCTARNSSSVLPLKRKWASTTPRLSTLLFIFSGTKMFFPRKINFWVVGSTPVVLRMKK